MPVGIPAAAAVIGAGATVYGASKSANAAKQAASTQAAAADKSVQLQYDIYNQNRNDQAPWRQTGSNALAMLADSLGLSGPEGNARAKGAFQTSPGYDFAFEQGKRGVEGSLAAKGMSRSGAAAKKLDEFGTGMADQEWGAWSNRLGQLAGFGSTANTQGAASSTSYATGATNAMQNAAAARASGYVNSASAWNDAGNSLAKLAGGTNWSGTGGGGGITPAMTSFNYGDWLGG